MQVATMGRPAEASATSAALTPFTIQEVGQAGQDSMVATANVADKITAIARSGDIDEVGKSLSGLLSAARQYDPSSFAKGGFLGFFRKKLQDVRSHFQTVDSQVDQLVNETDQRISLFRNRIGDLEQLYNQNEAYHAELEAKIKNIVDRVEWMKQNVPVPGTNGATAQSVADWNAIITYAGKRADDLRRAQVLSEQQGPQIKLMAMNSAGLVQKFSEVKTTTIPILKNAFALYILNEEAGKGAAFADSIDDLTNKTLQENAKKLGQNTVAINKSLSRSTVDLDTLRLNHAELLKSLDSVTQIQTEMKDRLAKESPQIEQLSQDLVKRLASPPKP